MTALLGQGGDVLFGDHHRLTVVGFIGFGDIAVLDHVTAFAADALILDAAIIGGVNLVELQVMVLGGAVDLYRDVDQTEGYGAFPDGTHGISMPSRC